MVVVLVTGAVVHEGDKHQVETHAQVRHGQVAHEEPGDGQLGVPGQQRDENGQVPCHGTNGDDPGEAAQEGEAQQVLAGVEGVRLRGALHKCVAETKKVQFGILKVNVINATDVPGSRLPGGDRLQPRVAFHATKSLFGGEELKLTLRLHVGHISPSGSLRDFPFENKEEVTKENDNNLRCIHVGGGTSVCCATCGRRSSGWGR